MENVKNKKQLVIIAAMFVFVLALICACTNATTAQAKVKKPSRAKIASVKSSIKTWHKDYGDGWGATCAKLKIKVTVKKVKKATGYDVKISKNKKFKNKEPFNMASKWVKTKSGKSKIKTFGNNFVQLDTKYYIKARAYKKSSGKKVYGKWSKVKTVAALKLPTNNNADEEQANDENNKFTLEEQISLYMNNIYKGLDNDVELVKVNAYYYPSFNDWDTVAYAQKQKEITQNLIEKQETAMTKFYKSKNLQDFWHGDEIAKPYINEIDNIVYNYEYDLSSKIKGLNWF